MASAAASAGEVLAPIASGLSTNVWAPLIGWVMPAGAAAVGDLLAVPEGRRVRTLVSLGYPTDEGARPKTAPGTARRPLGDMVRFERFS